MSDESQVLTAINSGTQTIFPVTALASPQIVYLDFDGELTAYHGEILTVDEVTVEDSGLSEERIAQITAALNEQFANQNVLFVLERPVIGNYSTIYIGKTSAFAPYGYFAGLAETVDSGNLNRSDNAFVMLDSTDDNARIVEVIVHETEHLLGTLDHGGDGMDKYAKIYYIDQRHASTGIILGSGDTMYVSSGGVANNTTVNQWAGRMYVSSGGTANGVIINSHGYLCVSKGATAINITVDGDASVYMTIAPNTYIQGQVDGSAFEEKNGYMSGVSIGLWLESLYISSGGTGDALILDRNELFVFNGGSASGTTVNFLGRMYVSSGGTSLDIKENGGWVDVEDGGYATFIPNCFSNVRAESMSIHSGTTAIGVSVSYSSFIGMKNSILHVYSGGTALHVKEEGGEVVIDDGAEISFVPNCFSDLKIYHTATVHSGTTASHNSVINSQASLCVYDGGLAEDTEVVSYGRLNVYKGGVATRTKVGYHCGMKVFSGGTANDITVTGGWGALYVENGGTVRNAVIKDYFHLSGIAYRTSVYGACEVPAVMYVCSGGTASNNDIGQSGQVMVSTGGTLCNTYIHQHSIGARILSGGVAIQTWAYGVLSVDTGGIAISTTITETAKFTFSNKAIIKSTVIESAASLTLASGFSAQDTIVNMQGKLYVSKGGSAIGTLVEYGGTMNISSGGTGVKIKENGGCVNIADGAKVTFLENSFSNVDIDSKTTATVHSGTTANNATVRSGSILKVFEGGLANSTHLAGGQLIVSGGTVKDTEGDGTLLVSSGIASRTSLGRIFGNYVVVLDGGVAKDTDITWSNCMVVSSGGTAIDTMVGEYGVLSACVGGTLSSASVVANGRLFVDGEALNITEDGGYVSVKSGAKATFVSHCISGLKLDEYRSATIHSNTTATEAQITSAKLYVVGGIIKDASVYTSGRVIVQGGTAVQTIVEGGELLLSDSGTANHTIVSAGKIYISSGGTANYTIVSSGGMYISSGGFGMDTSIENGYLCISNKGSANGIIVNGGRLSVDSEGTALNITENGGWVSVNSGANVSFVSNCISNFVCTEATTVHSGTTILSASIATSARMYVYSGGIVNNVSLDSKGVLSIASGGTAINIDWKPCVGSMVIASGAVITFASQYSGCYYGSNDYLKSSSLQMDGPDIGSSTSMYVMNNGIASNAIVKNGGRIEIWSGGTLDGTVVKENGNVVISTGGNASSVEVEIGGFLHISNGGSAVNIKEAGGSVYIDVGANVTFASNVFSGKVISSRATVHSGTTAIDNTLTNYASLEIKGGEAIATTIDNASIMYVFSGGKAEDTIVNAGYLRVSSCGSADNVTVNGGFLYIYDGGTASNIKENGGYIGMAESAQVSFASNCFSGMTLSSRTSVTAHSGTTATQTIVSGALLYIVGGLGIDTVVKSGLLSVSNQGVIDNTTCSGGSLQLSGATASNTQILGYAQMTILADGIANNTQVSGGQLTISSGGKAHFTTVSAAGIVTVYDDGEADNTTVLNGGLRVESNGKVRSTTLNQGGREYVYGNGETDDTTVNSGGILYMSGSDAKANNVTVNAGGTLSILSGTVLNIVENGGCVGANSTGNITFVSNCFENLSLNNQATLHSGTTAVGTLLTVGGKLNVYASGSAVKTTISNGGSMTVLNAGVAFDTSISSGGRMYVSNGGSADSISIASGGILYNNCVANNIMVSCGGALYIYQGGSADSISIASGGIMDISSNCLAGNVMISCGGTLSIASGAVVDNIVVASGGYLFVSSGGTAQNVTWTPGSGIVSSARGATVSFADTFSGCYYGSSNQLIYSSSQLSGISLDGNASMYVVKQGIADSVAIKGGKMYVGQEGLTTNTVLSSGLLEIISGGVMSNTIISNGSMVISNCGLVNGTTISGGQVYISGGTASDTTISNGSMVIFSGLASDTTISNGSMVIFSGLASDTILSRGGVGISGGTANGTTILGGSMFLWNGAALNDTIIHGGYLYITNGCGNNISVNQDGNLVIYDTALGIKENGGNVDIMSGASAEFVANCFSGLTIKYRATVHSGTTAIDTILSSGSMTVFDGGSANNTSVTNNGIISIMSGGTANHTSLLSGSAIVYEGGCAVDTLNHREMHVKSGGTAINTINNENMTISSGGIADGIVIGSSAMVRVSSGGTAHNIDWTPCVGSIHAAEGAEITFASQYSGCYYGKYNELISSALQMDNLVISQGGSAYIIGDGKLYNAVVYGTVYALNGGLVQSATVTSSKHLIVYNSGLANDTILKSGYIGVYNGGVANNTIVSGGGVSISSGGVANSTTINTGHVSISSGGVANNTTINTGYVSISSGGVANNTTVNTGSMYISSGGIADGIVIVSSGRVQVDRGGTAHNIDWTPCVGSIYAEEGAEITFASQYSGCYYGYNNQLISSTMLLANKAYGRGETIYVMSGGTLDNVMINCDSAYVWNGGIVRNTTVSDGQMFISSGGFADSTTVASNGYLFLYSGAVLDNATISSGAHVEAEPFATLNNTIVKSGGSLKAYSGTTLDNIIVSNGGVLNLTNASVSGLIIYSGGTVSSYNQTSLSDVQIMKGANVYVNTIDFTVAHQTDNNKVHFDRCGDVLASSYTITVNPDQKTGAYALAGEAAHFSERITVKTTDNTVLGTLSVDESKTFGDFNYSLTKDDDVLTLHIDVPNFNLSVDSLKVSSANLMTGQDVKLSFCIKNIGSTTAAKSKTFIFDGSEIIGTVSVDSLLPGESAMCSYTIGSEKLSAGTKTFKVVADGPEDLKESDKSNNSKSVSVLISLSPQDSKLSSLKSTELPDNGNGVLLSWNKSETAQWIDEYKLSLSVNGKRLDIPEIGSEGLEVHILEDSSITWSVTPAQADAMTDGPSISFTDETDGEPQLVQGISNDLTEAMLTRNFDKWNGNYQARHVGSIDDWSGTKEVVKLDGKNQIADVFVGSQDTTLLYLTDDANGDALFVDDIYSELPGALQEQQARIAQIDEIRAGAGDDIVDMTSQRFEYIGDGVIIRGGLGDDTIWANKGNNTLFGDAGNDRLVGASDNDILVGGIGNDSMHGGGGDDIFCFCDDWGQDTVEQLATGKVTLWFNDIERSKLTLSAGESGYALFSDDNGNDITVKSVLFSDISEAWNAGDNAFGDKLSLKFGDDGSEQYDNLLADGAFEEFTSERIFENRDKGLLA